MNRNVLATFVLRCSSAGVDGFWAGTVASTYLYLDKSTTVSLQLGTMHAGCTAASGLHAQAVGLVEGLQACMAAKAKLILWHNIEGECL